MIEKLNRPIPEYNHRLYENGYEPWEILAAAHKKILAAAAQEQPEDYTVNIKTETKVTK